MPSSLSFDRHQIQPMPDSSPHERPIRRLSAGPNVRLPERASSSEMELDDSYFERQAEEEALTFLPRTDVR